MLFILSLVVLFKKYGLVKFDATLATVILKKTAIFVVLSENFVDANAIDDTVLISSQHSTVPFSLWF